MVPSCAEGGVLGILPGLLGTIQATEVIKLILDTGEPLIGRFLLVDALTMRFRELKINKDPECPVCGVNRTIHKLIDYEEFCGLRGGPNPVPGISARELKARLDRREDILVLDVREPHEYQICNIGGRLVPLAELPKRLGELERDREIVVHCKSGARSEKAIEMMRNAGFQNVKNLTGGILAWAEQVDPSMTKY
jgi:adenylyltransferase/sulfurtransferase